MLLMPSRTRYHIAALLGYGFLALALTWPLARQLGSAIPGDSFDGWQNLWNLWWMREAWLVRHISPYFSDMLFAPTGADLRFQTMAPFNGFLFMNVQTAAGLIPAYNAAVLFSFVAGGYGAFLLALYALRGWQRLPKSPLLDNDQPASVMATPKRLAGDFGSLYAAAFIAGIVFAFSPYHFAHTLGHLQLIALQWIPFYVLYLLRGLDRAARPAARGAWLADAAKAGLFLTLVGLCDWYYVMYCLFFTALALLVWLARRRLTWRSIAVVAGAGIFLAVALSPLLFSMVRGTQTWGGTSLVRDYTETLALSADLLAFVTPQVFHPLWGQAALARGAAFTATPSEYTVFAGLHGADPGRHSLCWLHEPGAATPAARPRRPGFYLLSAAFFALLALGPVLKINGRTDLLPGGGEIPLPYRLLYETVPFIKLSRSVSRMDVMVMLFLGVAAAFAVVWLVQRLQAGRQAGSAARRRHRDAADHRRADRVRVPARALPGQPARHAGLVRDAGAGSGRGSGVQPAGQLRAARLSALPDHPRQADHHRLRDARRPEDAARACAGLQPLLVSRPGHQHTRLRPRTAGRSGAARPAGRPLGGAGPLQDARRPGARDHRSAWPARSSTASSRSTATNASPSTRSANRRSAARSSCWARTGSRGRQTRPARSGAPCRPATRPALNCSTRPVSR